MTVFLLAFHVNLHNAAAQDGSFLEGLFRTITEAKIQRDREKEAERRRREEEARRNPPSRQPESIGVPTSGFPSGPFGRAPESRAPQRPTIARPTPRPSGGPPTSINVRSRKAADFVRQLVGFNDQLSPLIDQLRRDAAKQSRYRAILPDAYRVAADTRALIQRCDGLQDPLTLNDPYCELDARWRTLSFRLRSLDGLSSGITTYVRQCDKLCRAINQSLGIDPQFDRHGLHDLLIVAATHMQTLLDDLRLSGLPRSQCESLEHDGRLLRQRLIAQADQIEEVTYQDVVVRFSDFVHLWQPYAARISQVGNAYLNRRLDRISECGDKTYALLWMPPPRPPVDLVRLAKELQASCNQMLDQLSFRAMVSLSRQQQLDLLEQTRRLDELCRRLQTATAQGRPRGELETIFADIDRTWVTIMPTLQRLTTIEAGTVDSIRRGCRHLREVLGGGAPAPVIDMEALLSLAASLEGSAEYFDADVRRYERYLTPSAYRESVREASRDFYRYAKRLHHQIESRDNLSNIEESANKALRAFDSLNQ
ncbi:MAG: hypothetical protein AAGA03_19885, partial [Planctomycetota bacterium]